MDLLSESLYHATHSLFRSWQCSREHSLAGHKSDWWTGSGFSRTKWALGSLGWAVQPGLGRQRGFLGDGGGGLKCSGNIIGFRDLVSILIAASKLLRKSLSLDLAEESFPLAYCQRHFPWSNSSQACSHVDTGDMTVVLPVLHLNCQQNSINNIMEQIAKQGNYINQLLF